MNRKIFLDKLRIMATCAVVLLHTVTGVMDSTDMSGYPMERTLFLVLLDWITWCVPVFVLISGYLFLDPAKNISFQQMLMKYCRRILFALFLFGVPYACLELVVKEGIFRVGMLGDAVLMVCKGKGWAHMWYLYMILGLYFFTPLLKWLLQKMPRWGVYAVLAFLALGSSILPFLKKICDWEQMVVLPDGGIYLFYYLCGYLFVCAEEKGSKERKPLGIILLLVLFAGMACSRLFGDYSVRMAYNYPFTVVASLLIMQIARKKKGAKKPSVIMRTSGICFAIYLIHPVFLNVMYKFLHISLLDFPIWFSLPGIFVTVLLLSGIVAWLLCQIPLLRKYIL